VPGTAGAIIRDAPPAGRTHASAGTGANLSASMRQGSLPPTTKSMPHPPPSYIRWTTDILVVRDACR
jgi:hypothetical protein